VLIANSVPFRNKSVYNTPSISRTTSAECMSGCRYFPFTHRLLLPRNVKDKISEGGMYSVPDILLDSRPRLPLLLVVPFLPLTKLGVTCN
jgi:hypothetical protein